MEAPAKVLEVEVVVVATVNQGTYWQSHVLVLLRTCDSTLVICLKAEKCMIYIIVHFRMCVFRFLKCKNVLGNSNKKNIEYGLILILDFSNRNKSNSFHNLFLFVDFQMNWLVSHAHVTYVYPIDFNFEVLSSDISLPNQHNTESSF